MCYGYTMDIFNLENNLEHIGLEYEEVAELIDKNDLNSIDFNNKINQRYYVFHILKKKSRNRFKY